MLRSHLELARRSPSTFTIQYPPSRDYFKSNFRTHIELQDLALPSSFLLYCHIPFCEQRCSYCNFAIDLRSEAAIHARYMAALCRQLDFLEGLCSKDTQIGGIDIGGGTPTLMNADALGVLLEKLQPWIARCNAPIPLSIETTPSIAARDKDKLDVLVRGGVGRVSIGIQSTHEDVLVSARRLSSWKTSQRAIENLLTSGFKRVNADLIFGLPGQDVRSWREDVVRVAASGVDSITTYDCLYRGKGRGIRASDKAAPSPEAYARLYDTAYDALLCAGYHAPYGSLNFSRYAGETGTSAYFEKRLLDGHDYVGLGNYSSSLVAKRWWFAPYRVDPWLKAVEAHQYFPVGDAYLLPIEEKMAKYVLSSLSFGIIDPARFEAVFDVALDIAFGEALTVAQEMKWLERRDALYAVRPGVFDCLPQLRSLFYTAAAIDWRAREVPTPKEEAPLVQINKRTREEISVESTTTLPSDDIKKLFDSGLSAHHLNHYSYPVDPGVFRAYTTTLSSRDVLQGWEDVDDYAIYVHVPFCETRCGFCIYNVISRPAPEQAASYTDSLLREIEEYAPFLSTHPHLVGFDLGGGTPTYLPSNLLERIVSRISSFYTRSASGNIVPLQSIEATPRSLVEDPDKAMALRQMGFNRISIGVQSASPDILRSYRQAHNTPDVVVRAVQQVKDAGFLHINIDLLYGFAKDTEESWGESVNFAISLEPETISIYRLDYKGAPIATDHTEVTLTQTNVLYALAYEKFTAAGYSAIFGQDTFTSAHDGVGRSSYSSARYMRATPYLGLGLGAKSMHNSAIYYNHGAAVGLENGAHNRRLDKYQGDVNQGFLPIQDYYALPQEELIAASIATSFGMGFVDMQALGKRFAIDLNAHFAREIKFLRDHALVQQHGQRLELTKEGFASLSGVLPLFYSRASQRFVLGQ